MSSNSMRLWSLLLLSLALSSCLNLEKVNDTGLDLGINSAIPDSSLNSAGSDLGTSSIDQGISSIDQGMSAIDQNVQPFDREVPPVDLDMSSVNLDMSSVEVDASFTDMEMSLRDMTVSPSDMEMILPVCGDLIMAGREVCDDGNNEDGDYCSADCLTVTGSCGDGIVQKFFKDSILFA